MTPHHLIWRVSNAQDQCYVQLLSVVLTWICQIFLSSGSAYTQKKAAKRSFQVESCSVYVSLSHLHITHQHSIHHTCKARSAHPTMPRPASANERTGSLRSILPLQHPDIIKVLTVSSHLGGWSKPYPRNGQGWK